MAALDRILVDKFSIEDAISFEELESYKNDDNWLLNHIFTMENVFEKYPKIVLNSRKEELFLNGVRLTFKESDGLYNIYSENGKYIGLGIVKDELLKRDIVI